MDVDDEGPAKKRRVAMEEGQAVAERAYSEATQQQHQQQHQHEAAPSQGLPPRDVSCYLEPLHAEHQAVCFRLSLDEESRSLTWQLLDGYVRARPPPCDAAVEQSFRLWLAAAMWIVGRMLKRREAGGSSAGTEGMTGNGVALSQILQAVDGSKVT